jgi:alkanesulfonate monooxygenase SsuD/methylene tetrahydromethanopterin reductase-like flavin-dependent oxidoreductase (luciferase family)
MGINRHIVVAETEAKAREIAGRGYRPWRKHMEHSWAKYEVPFPLGASLPAEWDALQDHGHAIAGTPSQVQDYIAGEIEAASASYFVCDFAFGTIGFDEALDRIIRHQGHAGFRQRLTRRVGGAQRNPPKNYSPRRHRGHGG